MTRETVERDTPACLAISIIVRRSDIDENRGNAPNPTKKSCALKRTVGQKNVQKHAIPPKLSSLWVADGRRTSSATFGLANYWERSHYKRAISICQ